MDKPIRIRHSIASLKNGISSEIEGKILNILAFVLSINELIQLIKNIVLYANGHTLEIGISSTGVLFVLVILFIARRQIK